MTTWSSQSNKAGESANWECDLIRQTNPTWQTGNPNASKKTKTGRQQVTDNRSQMTEARNSQASLMVWLSMTGNELVFAQLGWLEKMRNRSVSGREGQSNAGRGSCRSGGSGCMWERGDGDGGTVRGQQVSRTRAAINRFKREVGMLLEEEQRGRNQSLITLHLCYTHCPAAPHVC